MLPTLIGDQFLPSFSAPHRFPPDVLNGQAGNDTLDGGVENDTLIGDPGNGSLFGHTTATTIADNEIMDSVRLSRARGELVMLGLMDCVGRIAA